MLHNKNAKCCNFSRKQIRVSYIYIILMFTKCSKNTSLLQQWITLCLCFIALNKNANDKKYFLGDKQIKLWFVDNSNNLFSLCGWSVIWKAGLYGRPRMMHSESRIFFGCYAWFGDIWLTLTKQGRSSKWRPARLALLKWVTPDTHQGYGSPSIIILMFCNTFCCVDSVMINTSLKFRSDIKCCIKCKAG